MVAEFGNLIMLTLKATHGLVESFPINIAGGAVGPFVSKFDIIEIRLKGEGLLCWSCGQSICVKV
jgi:hypothetical protein